MRKTKWTDQEDKILLEVYKRANCFQKWKFISEQFRNQGFEKTESECRQRFVNKINPDLKKDRLSCDELADLFKFYDEYGPLWSEFEALIPGRNQNLLKNKFYSTLRSLFSLIRVASKRENLASFNFSSKLILEIYSGKKSFRKYKPLLRRALKFLNYEICPQKVEIIENVFGKQMLQKLIDEISHYHGQSSRRRNSQNQIFAQVKARNKKQSEQIQEEPSDIHIKTEDIKSEEVKATEKERTGNIIETPQCYPMYNMGLFLPYYNFPNFIYAMNGCQL